MRPLLNLEIVKAELEFVLSHKTELIFSIRPKYRVNSRRIHLNNYIK